jgi:hypothetical protein
VAARSFVTVAFGSSFSSPSLKPPDVALPVHSLSAQQYVSPLGEIAQTVCEDRHVNSVVNSGDGGQSSTVIDYPTR